jgi:hypothetical protein
MLFLIHTTVKAQDGFDDEYSSEMTYGINFNTNAGLIGGFSVKYSRLYKSRLFYTLSLEVANVKHEKELRVINQVTEGRFIFGKEHYLFPVRPQFGFEYILFKKAPDQGIQINSVVAAGPSFGIEKPYFILYNYPGEVERLEPYEPEIHTDPNSILGSGGYTRGFDQASIIPGGHIKAGLSFEYGKLNEEVVGMEIGFLYEAYRRDPEILSNLLDFNRRQFTSAYITLYVGRKR